MSPPVTRGDLIMLSPAGTGLSEPAWAFVELVELHADPSELPWNSGPDFPWRVGYRITVKSPDGAVSDRFGTVWIDESADDARGVVIGLERGAPQQIRRSPSEP